MNAIEKAFVNSRFPYRAVPGLFTKQDLIRFGEKHGLRITDYGGKYVFSLHGKKL